VLATDLDPLVLLIEKNINKNKEIISLGKGSVEFHALDWTYTSEAIEIILKKFEFTKIDYIIAADVIFNKTQLYSFSQV
jgi:hypothetical protein